MPSWRDRHSDRRLRQKPMSLTTFLTTFLTHAAPWQLAPPAGYALRMASSIADLRAAQALRFAVFNVEMQEGLSQSYETGLDEDAFDAHCQHLIVQTAAGQVVGTYRMQLGRSAEKHLGYYSAREFDLGAFEPLRSQVLELGRACIDGDHRNFTVLSLLWKGIMAHAQQHDARYLLGCSSLTSQSPHEAWDAYAQMQSSLARPAYRVQPLLEFACPQPAADVRLPKVKLPKLLSAYLALGAEICGPPAIDREFKTIDFLTLMDLESPQMAQRRRRFGIL
jgi:putative hemolysin